MELNLAPFFQESLSKDDIFQHVLLFVPTKLILESFVFANQSLKNNIENNQEFWRQKIVIDFNITDLKSFDFKFVKLDAKNYYDLYKLCYKLYQAKRYLSIDCIIDVYDSNEKLFFSRYDEEKGLEINFYSNPFYSEAKLLIQSESKIFLQKAGIEFVTCYDKSQPFKMIGFRKGQIPKFNSIYRDIQRQNEFTCFLTFYETICSKLFDVYKIDLIQIQCTNNDIITVKKNDTDIIGTKIDIRERDVFEYKTTRNESLNKKTNNDDFLDALDYVVEWCSAESVEIDGKSISINMYDPDNTNSSESSDDDMDDSDHTEESSDDSDNMNSNIDEPSDDDMDY